MSPPLVKTVCLLLVFCITHSYASLNQCTLHAGGDFIYSNNGGVTPGLLEYDIDSAAFRTSGNVYKDAQINSLFEKDSVLYFSGDIVRIGDYEARAVGCYNLNTHSFCSLEDGLWTLSNSLPTENGDISPTLLFSSWGDEILIGGHFSHGIKISETSLVNLVSYNPTTAAFSSIPQVGLCSGSCSIIALASDEESNLIIAATMSTSSYDTSISYFQGEQWTRMVQPTEQSVQLQILFNSFSIAKESSTLFAIAYKSQSRQLNDNQVDYFVVSWNLEDLDAAPVTTHIWQKSCSTSTIYYPSIDTTETNVFVAIPNVPCPTSESGIHFLQYDAELNPISFTVPTLSPFSSANMLEVVNEESIYISNGSQIQLLSEGEWGATISNSHISAFYRSESTETIYTGFDYGYEQFIESAETGRYSAALLVTGGFYSPGTVLSVAQLPNNHMMIGGDFKYVGDNVVGAKFAAVWDGTTWKPTLESNDNNYLAGWKLLSIDSVGDIIFGIADQGRDTDLLPLVRWKEDDGWLFLYKRPSILDSASWNNNIGTVHIDHTRNQVYFGGEFTVGLASGESCSGALIYDYLQEKWETLPANLTRVNAFQTLNNHQYMQIGGQFSYMDAQNVRHENYLVLDIANGQFLTSVPSPSNAEVFSLAIFPNQQLYSFLGGNFGQYGVEQLRSVGNIFSLSVVGNSPLEATVYSLASRNAGESLFAGGSFDGKLSELNIAAQEWRSIIPNSASWSGNVYSVILICPGDEEYYSVDSNWDDSSMLESFYSAQTGCDIPIGAPDDYVCPSNANALTVGQIIGLCFTVLITIVILAAIGYFAFKQIKQQQAEQSDSTVEYI